VAELERALPSDRAPRWLRAPLTGGGFGPEASLLAIVVCAVPTVLFLRAAGRRGLIYPRRRAAVATADR
jgi:hypothetical protein